LHGINTGGSSVHRLLGLAFAFLLVIPTGLSSPSILDTPGIVIGQTAEAATIPKVDFNGDGFSDLAIGVPIEDVGTVGDAGAVNVIYGSLGISINSGGLSATVPLGGFGRTDQIWTQDSPNIEDAGETDDRFGSSLA
jgi:hypothetical protein